MGLPIREPGAKPWRNYGLIGLAKLAEDINKSGHSVFSPSGSGMWLYCSGSLIPNMMEPDESSFEAVEGTVAHAVAEEWLRTGKRPSHLLNTKQVITEHGATYEVVIDRIMLDYVEEYVEWCLCLPGEHYVETRVFFSELTPLENQSGTADHVACMPGKMVITDLKYGKGVQVFAFENTQALLYALGFFLKYDPIYNFLEIEIRIAQPRFNHFDTWTVTRDELLEFAEYVKARTAAAWNLEAPRRPSEKACQWCRVKATCTALAKLADDLIEGNIKAIGREYSKDELDAFAESVEDGTYRVRPISVTQLSLEALAKVRPYRRLVESWYRSVDEHLERKALDGQKIPKMKLVESRTNRSFREPEAAVATLELWGLEHDDIFETSLGSPAQMEEKLRNKLGLTRAMAEEVLAPYVTKPPGKPTLVPETDKRPELNDFEENLWTDDDGLWDEDEEEDIFSL